MKLRFIVAAFIGLLPVSDVLAQELFVYSEPASNMPAHSVGLRVSNWLMDEHHTARINYHLIPEIMWGVNKNLMLHAEGFLSNRNKGMVAEGGAVYAKYRFYTSDQVHRHFRLAAFGRISANNADIHQQEIEINGHNTGFEAGIIATQLLHKTALSLSASYEQVRDNFNSHEFPSYQANKALNASLSAGHLFLPVKYTAYNQTNMNAMLEIIGQYHPQDKRGFVDIAPAIQFIFNSQTRVDVGYKFEFAGNMIRTAPNGLMVRVEHLLFNVL